MDGEVADGEAVEGAAENVERMQLVCMNVSFCARRAEGGGVLERGGTGLRDLREGKFRVADGSVMQPAAPPSKPAEPTLILRLRTNIELNGPNTTDNSLGEAEWIGGGNFRRVEKMRQKD
jgi:hypothetical protein